MSRNTIRLRSARQNNLKNVDLDLDLPPGLPARLWHWQPWRKVVEDQSQKHHGMI